MRHCAISSRFSANHSDSASHVTLHNLLVSTNKNLPRNVVYYLTSDECPPKQKIETKKTLSETVCYCSNFFYEVSKAALDFSGTDLS